MKNSLIILYVFMFLFSCVDKKKTLDNGVEIKYLKRGDGQQINDGEIVMLNLQYFDHDGNELLDKTGKDPVVLQKDSSWKVNGVIYEVIDNLGNGDSVFFQLTTEQFFKNAPQAVEMPDSVKNKLISFYCSVQEIMSQQEFEDFQREQYEKMQIEMEQNNEQQLSIDLELIENYLKDNNIDATKAESGLHYVINKKGNGDNAAPGDNVTVHYTGMLLNGEVFDSSVERDQPFKFQLGQGSVIRGWDEGITYFNKGAIGTIYIPSSLGYGPSGAGGGVIPPNAVLIFDIEVLDY
ncbi:MAG: FKBP-type peptidyl-prolyl cis-trans isomerase [Cytophagales bacterium]|nr:FKBP-type peptidyl-prolyl cis-trans isomerase [Cytophagales bacterium]